METDLKTARDRDTRTVRSLNTGTARRTAAAVMWVTKEAATDKTAAAATETGMAETAAEAAMEIKGGERLDDTGFSGIKVIQGDGFSYGVDSVLLAAWAKGIGSCWLSAPQRMGFGPAFQRRFAPDKGEFVAAVTLGYPDQQPKMPPRRDGRYLIV